MVPWKFLFSILVLVLLIFFIGLNLQNEAEIRFWFGETGEKTLNVVLALFGGFLLGVAVTLPYVLKRRVKYVDLSHERRREEKAKKRTEKKNKSKLSEEKNKEDLSLNVEFKSLNKSKKG